MLRTLSGLMFASVSLLLIGNAENSETLTLNVRPEWDQTAEVVFQNDYHSNPDGVEIAFTHHYLTLCGQPWMPVMGEFHYSRFAPEQWEQELRKMKAGGVDVVATYVFWNHHEEKEGEWDWSGSRDLRKFVLASKQTGLKLALRIGPWAHGEVRYGGLPDWIVDGDWKVRSTDRAFLEKVEHYYSEIGEQVKDLMWKEGGPIIAIQLDNEFSGPSAYLLALKQLAIEAGLQAPLYTRTGWPKLQDRMPFGEIMPLFGVYAEGFWNASLEAMPGNYREGFHFSQTRTSSDIGSDQLGTVVSEDETDARQYPYLTCEVGGGMMNSYHRRVYIEPEDVESTALVKFGSGGNLLGYYMYHGGWNPDGKYTTLQESLETHYPNDMPVKNYDFQAPVGADGSLRPQYHGLRQMHLFMRDYQQWIVRLETFLPEARPMDVADTATLRWSVRSNGNGGLLFFNNYERLQQLTNHEVQFQINDLQGGGLRFPKVPVCIADGEFGYWPFRMEIAPGFEIEWITAQPLCRYQQESGDWYVFFKKNKTSEVELALKATDVSRLSVSDSNQIVVQSDGLEIAGNLATGLQPSVKIHDPQTGNDCFVVILNECDASRLWKGEIDGKPAVVWSNADVVFDDSSLDLKAVSDDAIQVYVLKQDPGDAWSIESNAASIDFKVDLDGIWQSLSVPETGDLWLKKPVDLKKIRSAGGLREIPLGPYRSKVAMAPLDAVFETAAKWEVGLPEVDMLHEWQDVRLSVHYQGDVLRLLNGDRLKMDDFYNGQSFSLSFKSMMQGFDDETKITLEILPLSRNAPIYLYPAVRQSLPETDSILSLDDAFWIFSNSIKVHF